MEAWARSAIAVRPSTSHEAKPEIAIMFAITPFWPKPKSLVKAAVRKSV